MQVSVETTSELSRKMTIQVPEGKIQEKIDSRLKSMSNKVRIDGFRPGRVPQSVIKKRYGQQIREEVLSELIQSSFYEAIRDEQLRPAGVPEIVARKADEGEGLEYEANFEVMPDFVPMPLETLDVTRYLSEVTEGDVDGMVERLREQRKTWREVDRPSAWGDRVAITFEGWLGEESFTNGRVENFPVVLGSNQMIPGFEERLVGAHTGAKLEFDLDFPEEYPGEKMAGKTGHFSIEVGRVEESVIPELDAEFAKSFGIDDGNFDALRSDIRSNMEREMRRALQARTKSSVMDQLYGRNSIVLPNALIKDEFDNLSAPYRESARKHKQTLDEDKLREQLDPVVRRRVALAIILGKIIETYKVTVDPSRVRSTVEDLATSYEEPSEVVRWYYADKQRLREIENIVTEDQIVDLILERAKVTDEFIGFHELMQPAAGNAQPPAGV